MRLPGLPWPFRRGPQTAADAAAERAARQPTSPAATIPDGTAVRTGAWASLPAIQGVIANAPLVSRPESFLEDIPGVRGLPPILRPLAHEISPLAPQGVVATQPHAVPTLTSHAALVPRPIQRREAADASTRVGMADSAAVEAPAHSPAPPAPPSAASHVGGGPPVVAEPSGTPPVRRVQAIAPASIARPLAVSLTRAPTPSAVVPKSPAPVSPSHGSGLRTAPAPGGPGRPDLPPGTRGGGQSAVRAAAPVGPPPVQRRSASASNAPAAPSRPAVPPPAQSGASPVGSPSGRGPMSAPVGPPASRRAGLGAPIASRPPGAAESPPSASPAAALAGTARPGVPAPRPGDAQVGSAGRSASIDAPLGGSMPLGPTVQRRTHGAAEPARPDAAEAAGAAEVPTAGLPVLPVARTPGPVAPDTDAAASGRERAATSPLAAPAAGSSVVGGASGRSVPVRPLVDVRAPRGGATLQRSPADTARAGGAAAAPAVAHGSVPPARGGDDPAPLRDFDRFGMPGRGSADWLGWPSPIVAGTPMPTARPIPHGSPAGAVGSPQRAPVGVARTAPVGAALPLAHVGPPSPPPQVPRVSRAVEASPAPPLEPNRAEPSAPVLAPTATPVVQRVDGAAPRVEPTAGSSVPSDEELDALVKASFGRFRTRLRNELIHEREARGLTFDQV